MGWLAATASAAVVLAVGVVVSVQLLRGTAQPPSASVGPVSSSAGPTSAASPTIRPVEVDIQAWIDGTWPSLIPGPFGTLDSTAYDSDPGATLGHMPAVDGPFIERWFGGPAGTTYVYVSEPRTLADSTQLIVRGRPLAFSRPYFNSTNGEFWTTELIGVRDGVNADDNLQRDVLFQAEEVLGTTLPEGFEPGLVQFTVTAGQVVVDLPRDVRYDDHVLEAGRYQIREQPGAELRVGEEVVLFLRYGDWLGLDGDRYVTRTTLVPAHPLYYAFRVVGDQTLNLSTQGAPGRQWSPTVAHLREIARALAPQPAQPLPDARVHPARPSHDENEQPLPSPTPCSPLAIIDYWRGYASLDDLLEEADLVVVARLTTRAREEGAFSDALVTLVHDTLIERTVTGDVAPGSLIPVERLAARDPACGLIIDGIEPLTIDGPYLMALRRDGEAYVLLEAPRELAEVRDGLLVSERWPELDGLTVDEARERTAPK